ncbi:MAG TPA: CpsD/CapB family tyrosine-protein kinase [Phycisphaerae bacterium]|nr:CpsD/CapB family tyrosine-protein kinase [Phycisphaerae bacterium]
MSETPDKQDQKPQKPADEDFEMASEPEQIWPPPESAGMPPAGPEKGEESDLDWSKEVGKIDEAIEEIELINGVPQSEAVGEVEELEGQEGVADVHATAGTEEIVAGKVGLKPEPKVGSVTEATYRVREEAEAELGQLWGSIFYSADRPAPKAIIVTAARRRDGATQIAVSLALVGAEASRERRIALVDFNLRNPAVAEVLGIPGEPGLTDVLDGRIALEAAMHAVRLPNGNMLYVLPAGAAAEQPLGLLKSRQAQAVIARLQERYDHTIIDVTTANAHPDPQVIGGLVKGALLVARAGETPRETVAEAKKRLDLAGVQCLGLVMNQRSDPIPDFLYRRT